MSFKLHCGVFIRICCVQGSVYGVQHMAEWLSRGFPLFERSLLPAALGPPASHRHLRRRNQRPTAEDRWGAEWENPAVRLALRSGCLSLWQRSHFTVFLYACDRQCRLFRLYQSLCTTTCPACHKNIDLYLNISFWLEEYNYMKFWSSEIQKKMQISTAVKVVIANDNKRLWAFPTDLCLCHNNLRTKLSNYYLKIVIEKSWKLVQNYKVIEMYVVNSNLIFLNG